MTGLFEYYVCAQSQNRSSKIHLFSFENIQNSSVNLAILWLNNRIQMTMPLVVWAFLNYTFLVFTSLCVYLLLSDVTLAWNWSVMYVQTRPRLLQVIQISRLKKLLHSTTKYICTKIVLLHSTYIGAY